MSLGEMQGVLQTIWGVGLGVGRRDGERVFGVGDEGGDGVS